VAPARVLATLIAPETLEVAAAKLAEERRRRPSSPPEVYFGLQHIQEADRALERFIMGKRAR
jgi:hypothetical protein